jgi:hypothetical protein
MEENLKIEELEARKLKLKADIKILKEKHEYQRELNKQRILNLKKAQTIIAELKRLKLQQIANLQLQAPPKPDAN